MSGTPYIRFYGDDWLSGTQDLTLEERGALITIVALTASRGKSPNADFKRLSHQFACSKKRAEKIVKSLINLDKIYLSNDQLINKRAKKETEISQKKSQKQTENINKRWEEKNKKCNEINDRSDTTVLPPYIPKAYQPEPEPEPEPYIKKRDTNVSQKKDLGLEFEELWERYPKKVEKKAAKIAWMKARRKNSFDTISNPLSKYCELRKDQDPRYTISLGRWLDRERWRDIQEHAANRSKTSDEELDALMASEDDELNKLFPERIAIQ